MDGLIFFPWEPCFSLPGQGLGRLPRCRGRWLRRGGSWQGRSDGTARGLKGPSPLAPRYFHHRHPGVTWLSRSLLLPTFESQSQKTLSPIQEPWAMALLQTLNKRGNCFTSQGNSSGKPSSSYAQSSPSCGRQLPSLCPQAPRCSPPSEDRVSGTFLRDSLIHSAALASLPSLLWVAARMPNAHRIHLLKKKKIFF